MRYDDIIMLKRPESKRKKMPVADRAKIFMPFAALSGYEDVIAMRQKVLQERITLSEERKNELDCQLKILDANYIIEKQRVQVQHFLKDEKITNEEGKDMGKYVITEGVLTKIDFVMKQIVVEEEHILIQNILEIRTVSQMESDSEDEEIC